LSDDAKETHRQQLLKYSRFKPLLNSLSASTSCQLLMCQCLAHDWYHYQKVPHAPTSEIWLTVLLQYDACFRPAGDALCTDAQQERIQEAALLQTPSQCSPQASLIFLSPSAAGRFIPAGIHEMLLRGLIDPCNPSQLQCLVPSCDVTSAAAHPNQIGSPANFSSQTCLLSPTQGMCEACLPTGPMAPPASICCAMLPYQLPVLGALLLVITQACVRLGSRGSLSPMPPSAPAYCAISPSSPSAMMRSALLQSALNYERILRVRRG